MSRADTLTNLIEGAWPTPWSYRGGWLEADKVTHRHRHFAKIEEDNAALICYFANNAPAIRDLIVAAEKLNEWSKKYPSSRIYSETAIRKIAAEIDEIDALTAGALANIKEQE